MTDDGMALEPLYYSETMKPFEVAAMSQAASFKRIADALEIMASRSPAPSVGASMGIGMRRAAAAPSAPDAAPAIDADGFTTWSGKLARPPVDGMRDVQVKLRNGFIRVGPAQTFHWQHGEHRVTIGQNGEQIPGAEQPTDILAFKLVPLDPALTS